MKKTLTFWSPAIAGMFCLGLGAGLVALYGFFVEPLTLEFGAGAALINSGLIIALLVPSIIAPIVGRIADRVPVRRLVLIGATVASCALLAISYAPSLLLAAVFFIFFAFGLTFYGPVVVNGLLVKLYVGREARAVAIAAIGISVASATLPPLMGTMLSQMEWRSALAALAVGVWIVLVAISFIALPAVVVSVSETAATAGEGKFRRGREFWLIGLCVAAGLSTSIVLAVVYPPHFVSEGYSLTEAGWFLSIAGMSGLIGKVCVGWLGDRGKRFAQWIAAALLLIQIGGMGLLLFADNSPQVVAALFFLGYGTGAFIPMHPYLNSCYFDAEVISEVMGAQMPLFLPFMLIGAPLAGYVFDRTGSYDLVFAGLMTVLVLAIFLALRLPQPEA